MRRYLIVDDNRAFAENLAEILTDAGATVDVAESPVDAVGRVRAGRYDALITDMKMPGMTGADLVRRVHEDDPGLPAIVITAYTNDADLSAARRIGLLAVLPKPAPVDRLVELVASARRGGLVVIVEEDQTVADRLCEALCERGFAAVAARSCEEAEELRGLRPFVALVDPVVPRERMAALYPGVPTLGVDRPSDAGPLVDAVDALFRAQA